jgi:hypothetical protein
MTLHRRHRIAAIAIVALLGAAAAAHASNSPAFYSRAIGFGIRRPIGWHWLSDIDALNKQHPRRLSDAELAKVIGNRPELALVQIAYHEEPYAGFNPSIQVSLKPLASFPSKNMVEALAPLLAETRTKHADLIVIDAPQEAKVMGYAGARMKVRYSDTIGGEMLTVAARLWLIPRGNFVFVIGMSSRAEGAESGEGPFAGALASIRILK